MDTNIEKLSKENMEKLKPYEDDEPQPDEIRTAEEFMRMALTLKREADKIKQKNPTRGDNNGKEWYGSHRIQDIGISVRKPESRSYHSAWRGRVEMPAFWSSSAANERNDLCMISYKEAEKKHVNITKIMRLLKNGKMTHILIFVLE